MTTPSTSAQGPVAGWKLVPIEPTEAMMDAAIAVIEKPCFPQDIYAAMLTASPSPAASDASPSGVDAVRADIDRALRGLFIPNHKRDDAEFLRGAASIGRSFVMAAQEKLASLASATPAPTSGGEDGGAAELLRKLEEACDNAAGKRSQTTYDQMISDPGAEDALEELDIARREARAFLNPSLYGRVKDGKR